MSEDLYELSELPDTWDPDMKAKALDEAAAIRHARDARVLRERIDTLNRRFTEEVGRLEQRRRELVGPLEEREGWHLRSIEGWHRMAYASKAEGLQVDLVHMTSKLNNQSYTVEVADEAAFREWCVANDLEGEFFPPKPATIAKAELKDRLVPTLDKSKQEPGTAISLATPDGEIAPGVHLQVNERSHGAKVVD